MGSTVHLCECRALALGKAAATEVAHRRAYRGEVAERRVEGVVRLVRRRLRTCSERCALEGAGPGADVLRVAAARAPELCPPTREHRAGHQSGYAQCAVAPEGSHLLRCQHGGTAVGVSAAALLLCS
jgi:hypothetical protein